MDRALTTLLVGIVSLNVLALSFNASSSRAGVQADALDREISALRAKIATNGASDQRVQAAAARLGLIVPEPGSVGTCADPNDAAVAAKRLASGRADDRALLQRAAGHGRRPHDHPDLALPGDDAPGDDAADLHDACG